MTNNTIASPKGFFAAGVSCGIKKSGTPAILSIQTVLHYVGSDS